MATDLFSLSGQWTTTPQTGSLLASGAPSAQAPLNEQVTLDQKSSNMWQLTSDAAFTVPFGAVVNANVICISCDHKVKLTVTSADGASQSFPVDDTLVLISRTVPFTALQLTRIPATLTNVQVFLGEKA